MARPSLEAMIPTLAVPSLPKMKISNLIVEMKDTLLDKLPMNRAFSFPLM
jgi:hypothetical protein